MSKTNYADSKKSTLAILEILKRETSENKTLTIQEIMKLVKECYDIEISRNTITATLRTLADFYGENVICCKRSSRGESEYTTSYYYKSANIFNELEYKVEKVRGIISEEKNHERGGQYDKEQWICFNLMGYGVDGTLGVSKKHEVYPLEVVEKSGQYYLVAAYEGTADEKFYHFRFDLMSDVVVINREARFSKEKKIKMRKKLVNLDDYVMKHTNMYSGDIKTFTLDAKYNGSRENGYNYLHDLFGKWMLVSAGEKSAKLVVYSTDTVMKIILEQYNDWLTLIRE